MKKLYSLLASVGLALLCCLAPKAAQASHYTSWDMAYRHLNGDTFKVILNIYVDCNGLSPSVAESICVKNKANTSFTAVAPGVFVQNVVSSCLHDTTNACTTPGSTVIGIRHWRYTVDVVLPQTPGNIAANQWTFGWSNSARNAAISNIINPSSTYAEAYLDNNILPQNNSAVFNELPYLFRCVNRPSVIPQGVTDSDGDSLVFALVPARGGGFGCPLLPVDYMYTAPYSGTYPSPAVSAPIISQVNGDVFLTPIALPFPMLNMAVYAINCKEFRLGVRIGEVGREMTVVFSPLVNCDTMPLTLGNTTSPFQIDTIQASCMDSILSFKTSLPFLCSTLAPDGSDFRVYDVGNGQPLAVAGAAGLFCNAGSQTQRVFLQLQQRLPHNGIYIVVSRMGNDQNTVRTSCGIRMYEFDTLAVVIANCAAYAQPQPLVCATVDSSENAIDLYWNHATPAIAPADFKAWLVYRRGAGNAWQLVGQRTNYNQLHFRHSSASLQPVFSPGSQSSAYAITMLTKQFFILPYSNAVSQIYLRAYTLSQADTLPLVWNAYQGWPAPQYEVQYADAAAPNTWQTYTTTPDTLAAFIKPDPAIEYRVRIHTSLMPGAALPMQNSYSNSLSTLAPLGNSASPALANLAIPSVLTPNGDGMQDAFVIGHLPAHTRLRITNLLGQPVYSTADYANTFTGEGLSTGLYLYTLTTEGKGNTQRAGSLLLLK